MICQILVSFKTIMLQHLKAYPKRYYFLIKTEVRSKQFSPKLISSLHDENQKRNITAKPTQTTKCYAPHLIVKKWGKPHLEPWLIKCFLDKICNQNYFISSNYSLWTQPRRLGEKNKKGSISIKSIIHTCNTWSNTAWALTTKPQTSWHGFPLTSTGALKLMTKQFSGSMTPALAWDVNSWVLILFPVNILFSQSGTTSVAPL